MTNSQNRANQEPKPITGTMNQSTLRNIVIQAKKINRLNNHIKHHIAPQWAIYYHVLNLKGNTLIIGVQSPSVAQRLRWSANDWLMALQQSNWPYIKYIEFKVMPIEVYVPKSITADTKQIVKKHSISAKTAKACASYANHMPRKLQKAWQRISQYLSQENENKPS